MVRSVFGAAVDCREVRVRRRKWWWLHPRHVTMAPWGHIHFHPESGSYCDDFSAARIELQAHFIHEMTHVWQAQTRGRWWVVLRGMWDRQYSYRLREGWPLERYGLEQQAEIVAHTFLYRRGSNPRTAASAAELERIVRFV
ncbi:vgr related protein [Novosphingobium sp.]|uniref:vgr related protein n=1 Tax=Novosphingobium sp. TaxID=1874826 RepID=UPI0035B06B5E